jgi:hypothetical protein
MDLMISCLVNEEVWTVIPPKEPQRKFRYFSSKLEHSKTRKLRPVSLSVLIEDIKIAIELQKQQH